jgi:two-component system, chemotaxis family, CheB/CheR fusion protein
VTRDLETLLIYLEQTRSCDFTAYKRSTLGRRVQQRMLAVGVENFGDYVDYLDAHPEEFASLFKTILINVTSFFRDPATWDWLRLHGIPRLIASAGGDPIRVWSAGCASGEEAYSLAMLLADTLGVDRFKEQVTIHATDIDDEALMQGRRGSYSEHQVAGVPEAALPRYFDRIDGRYTFNKELRRSVTFGRHDLIQDAPISRVGLLVCRNTLMYFNAEAQGRLLDRFHFALDDQGLLFLGKAEMLLARGGMFTPADLRSRIFEKLPRDVRRDRPLPPPDLDTNENDLRSNPAPSSSGPLTEAPGEEASAKVVVRDSTRFRRLQDELRGSHRELEAASEELRSSNEELETTNEELQSTVEELETTNDELQSTNQELETMNEELQSTNEELSAANDQLRQRGAELAHLNSFLESILTSLHQAVVVIDKDLRVKGWNRKAEDLWGVRTDEVQDQPFLNLAIGLRVDQLRQPIRDILSGERELQTVQVDAVNRRGRPVQLSVGCTPLRSKRGVRGVILMMEPIDAGRRQEG